MSKTYMKDKFGIFFRKKERIFDKFLRIKTERYISGHRGFELYLGSYMVNIIYKF